MLQRGSKTVPSGGQTRSDVAGAVALGRQQQQQDNNQLQPDCPRFDEWLDSSLDPTDTEISHLVSPGSTPLKINDKRCCKNSTSSGYSSHSPPLSSGSHPSPCCPNLGITVRGSTAPNPTINVNRTVSGSTALQQQPITGSLAVIHEAETIPRPIWPCGEEDTRVHHNIAISSAESCKILDCDTSNNVVDHENCRSDVYPCCGYCCSVTGYNNVNSCGNQSGGSSSAREVLLELSRTLHSVIDGETDHRAEDVLRDISMTVARGIRSKVTSSTNICDDYTYRLSSSSSSAGGKESVNVNPVNLRVYNKPKWINVHTPSKSQCSYENKFLLNAALRTSRTQPSFDATATIHDGTKKNGGLATGIFLVPQDGDCGYPRSLRGYPGRSFKVTDYKGAAKSDCGSGNFGGTKRSGHVDGRLNVCGMENCNDKFANGEPVYTTQLEGSDESSTYGAIDESTTKKSWNEGAKVFDRHLDFTLDGNRAERLGRAIANAKRKRQWCRGLTAIFGLVFFVLSVIVVSLSVTKGRKVFGSM